MHIPDKLLNSIACFAMALFFILVLISFKQVEKTQVVKTTPSQAEYWKGIPLAKMGLELIPLCDPIQVSSGAAEKFIPAIGVNGGVAGVPYSAHILWTEPSGDSREIIEAAGPIDGGDFCEPRLVTPANGYNSYNPMTASGMHYVYLGFMDEAMNIREIWFSAGDDIGWTNAVPVSGLDEDSRAWGPNPVAFFDGESGYELPLMFWFDHRYGNHEISFASRVKGVNFLGPGRGGFALEDSGWHSPIRITEDDWDQYDPYADWSSACAGLERNVIHLVYCDARFAEGLVKHDERKGNFEIFYRAIRPVGPLINRDKGATAIPFKQEWDIGEEVRLSTTPDISDAPSVCGKRFQGNADLKTAMVVWNEHNESWDKGEIHFCLVEDGHPGKLRLLTPPGAVAMYPAIMYMPINGHADLAAVCYQQYESGESFPTGTANIYMRIIDGKKISEPIKVSDSRFTCGFPRVTRPGYKLEDEGYALVAWGELRGGVGGKPDENQIFFRSFKVRER
jgi:hypothetical protein